MEERQILRSVELELESGEARAYELAEPAAFVPLLYMPSDLYALTVLFPMLFLILSRLPALCR